MSLIVDNHILTITSLAAEVTDFIAFFPHPLTGSFGVGTATSEVERSPFKHFNLITLVSSWEKLADDQQNWSVLDKELHTIQ